MIFVRAVQERNTRNAVGSTNHCHGAHRRVTIVIGLPSFLKFGFGAQARLHDNAGLNFLLRVAQGVLRTFLVKSLGFRNKGRGKRQ